MTNTTKITTAHLATGTLTLTVEPGRVPLSRLLGFAARVSSKRKFLLVSKVLAKHCPVKPIMMRWSYRALARKIVHCGIGANTLWIGMAETATGLGYGVYAAAVAEQDDVGLFMQTTRYYLSGLERLAFEEAHSHATDFFLYYPVDEHYRRQFLTADTLVLVDDEISTGKTFLRLIKAYQTVNPNLKKVLIVSLVNFAHSLDRQAVEQEADIDVHWLCFRQGLLHFDDAHNQAIDQVTVNVSGNGQCKKHLLAWPGRLGINAPINLETGVLAAAVKYFKTDDNRPILVLGTGECNAPAYLLACLLEVNGYAVAVQSTTRSPIHQGHDIASISQFEDNYDDEMPNFLYNFIRDHYREIIVCHETPLCPALLNLLDQWQAISARFELTPSTNHAKLHFFRSR